MLLAIAGGIVSAQESHQINDDKEKLVAFAGSYILDPTAVVQERTGPMLFKTPDDPGVCKLYLENLNHFAKKERSLDCERPISPHLAQRIQKIEWANLDSEKYQTIFREAVSVTRYGGSQPATEDDLRLYVVSCGTGAGLGGWRAGDVKGGRSPGAAEPFTSLPARSRFLRAEEGRLPPSAWRTMAAFSLATGCS